MSVCPAVLPERNVSVLTRLWKLLLRSVIAVTIVCGLLGVINYQAQVVPNGRLAEHPLLSALNSVGAHVQQTEILVRASKVMEGSPAFADIKRMADHLSGRMPSLSAAGVDYWSVAGDDYRAVYYEGREAMGGNWIASARHIYGGWPVQGMTEASLHRTIYGTYTDIKGAIEQGKRYVRSAVGGAHDTEHRVIISARPPMEGDRMTVAESILNFVGSDTRVLIQNDDQSILVGGYSPHLPGKTVFHGREVNVVVRITPHGGDDRIDVGYPRI